jgi:hypothetical protein
LSKTEHADVSGAGLVPNAMFGVSWLCGFYFFLLLLFAERDECYYPTLAKDRYEGKLNKTSAGSECESWTTADVKDRLANAHNIAFASDKWANGYLGDHNYCRLVEINKITSFFFLFFPFYLGEY